jgi:phospholipid transport system substrate-binding protein
MISKNFRPAAHQPANPRIVNCRWRAAALTIAFALLVAEPVTVAVARAQATSAMAVTQQMVNRALQILGDKATSVQTRRQELRNLIEPRFDFTEMSRSTLGYHWRTLSPSQRDEFTRAFTLFIEAAYLSKIQDYQGQQVEFGMQRSLGQGYAEVDTRIVQPGKTPIPVNYLLEQKDDTWKVYDVTVDSISIIANYRTQFNRVINEKGFDQLLADLKAKQRQLGESLGNA